MDHSVKFWDRAAKRYDRSFNNETVVSAGILDRIQQNLHPGDVVLDFACATGRYAIAIAQDVKSVWGMDVSTKMIEIANANAAEHQIKNVHFITGELSDTRLADESFDLVLALSILHLLDDPIEILSDLYRLLKSGGLFISSTPCLGAVKSLKSVLISLSGRLGIVPKTSPFRPSDIRLLICEANFQLLEAQYFTHQNPMVYIVAQKER